MDKIEELRAFYAKPKLEFAAAVELANRVLGDAGRDPDSDLSLLARQLLRRVENVDTLLTTIQTQSAALEQARATAYVAGLARAAEIAEGVGRPVEAGDGDTYISGSSADAARAIRAEIGEKP